MRLGLKKSVKKLGKRKRYSHIVFFCWFQIIDTYESTSYFLEHDLEQDVHFAKFLRRPDINAPLRMSLAYQALYLNEYGLITRLSEEHKVSREFIYQLRNQLQIWSVLIFGVLDVPLFEKTNHTKNEELLSISHILALRLEGHCPISGIHLLLKRGGFKNTSVGYISELLNSIVWQSQERMIRYF